MAISRLIVVLACLVALTTWMCDGQTTPEWSCIDTGPGCINTTNDCPTNPLVNGQLQWCFGCSNYITCNFGTGLFQTCSPGTYFDSPSQACQNSSTTCQLCVIPTPTTAGPTTMSTEQTTANPITTAVDDHAVLTTLGHNPAGPDETVESTDQTATSSSPDDGSSAVVTQDSGFMVLRPNWFIVVTIFAVLLGCATSFTGRV